jgi:hypothetical protein
MQFPHKDLFPVYFDIFTNKVFVTFLFSFILSLCSSRCVINILGVRLQVSAAL